MRSRSEEIRKLYVRRSAIRFDRHPCITIADADPPNAVVSARPTSSGVGRLLSPMYGVRRTDTWRERSNAVDVSSRVAVDFSKVKDRRPGGDIARNG